MKRLCASALGFEVSHVLATPTDLQCKDTQTQCCQLLAGTGQPVEISKECPDPSEWELWVNPRFMPAQWGLLLHILRSNPGQYAFNCASISSHLNELGWFEGGRMLPSASGDSQDPRLNAGQNTGPKNLSQVLQSHVPSLERIVLKNISRAYSALHVGAVDLLLIPAALSGSLLERGFSKVKYNG